MAIRIWRVLICICLSGFLLGASIGKRDAGASSAVTAVDSFQGCVSGAHGPVDVLVMMDITQSLTQGFPGSPATDPRNLRIVGLRAVLRSMASEHDINGAITYNVQMVGFGQKVKTFPAGHGLSSWTAVTDAMLPNLYRSTSIFTKPDPGALGAYTNFDAALQWANQKLRATSAACKAVLWFTDGALDLSNNGQVFPQTSLEKAAMTDICSPGGVANALWENNIWDFVVGLTNPIQQKGAVTLRSIATGGSSNYLYKGICGRNPAGISTSAQTGAYFGSPQAAQLIFEMQGLICSGSACRPTQSRPCATGVISCPANSQFPFWVGPGVASFTFDGLVPGIGTSMSYPDFEIIDTSSKQKIIVSVTPGKFSCSLPDGRPTNCAIANTRLSASTLTLGEIRVVGLVNSAISSGHQLLGIFRVPAGTVGGVTQTFFETAGVDLAFVPSVGVSASCPTAPNESAFIGCSSTGRVVVYYSGTHKPFPAKLGQIRNLSVNLAGSSHDQIPVAVVGEPNGQWKYSFQVPTSASAGSRNLVASGELALLQGSRQVSGINLSLSQPLSLVSPPGFPQVAVGKTQTIIQVGQNFSVPVSVTGSSVGSSGNGGCIAMDPAALTANGGIGIHVDQLTSTFPKTCQTLNPGKPATYLISGKLSEASNGTFHVSFRLHLGSSTSSTSFEEPLYTVSFQANVPVNVGGSALLTFLLILAALAGLLGVSMGVNWVTGRFVPLNQVLIKTVPARVSSLGLENEEGGPFDLPSLMSDSLISPESAAKREFIDPTGRLHFYASKTKFPVGVVKGFVQGPQATVESSAPFLILGNSTQVSGPRAGSFKIEKSLQPTWVFSVDSVTGKTPESAVFQGNLTIWMPNGRGLGELDSLVGSARQALREKHAELGKLFPPTPEDADVVGASSTTTEVTDLGDDNSDVQPI